MKPRISSTNFLETPSHVRQTFSFKTEKGLENSLLFNFGLLVCYSSVGIALGYGLDDRGSMVRFPAWAEDFSPHHRVQNGSGTHPAFYPMGTRSSFHGGKRPGREVDHSPPSSAEVKECVELYLHSSNTSSWHGA
jgi:hypothetical protein